MKFNFWKERDKVSEKYFISNCEQTTIVRVLLVAQCGTTVNQPCRRVDAFIKLLKGMFGCAFFTALRMDLISFSFLIILMGTQQGLFMPQRPLGIVCSSTQFFSVQNMSCSYIVQLNIKYLYLDFLDMFYVFASEFAKTCSD